MSGFIGNSNSVFRLMIGCNTVFCSPGACSVPVQTDQAGRPVPGRRRHDDKSGIAAARAAVAGDDDCRLHRYSARGHRTTTRDVSRRCADRSSNPGPARRPARRCAGDVESDEFRGIVSRAAFAHHLSTDRGGAAPRCEFELERSDAGNGRVAFARDRARGSPGRIGYARTLMVGTGGRAFEPCAEDRSVESDLSG